MSRSIDDLNGVIGVIDHMLQFAICECDIHILLPGVWSAEAGDTMLSHKTCDSFGETDEIRCQFQEQGSIQNSCSSAADRISAQHRFFSTLVKAG